MLDAPGRRTKDSKRTFVKVGSPWKIGESSALPFAPMTNHRYQEDSLIGGQWHEVRLRQQTILLLCVQLKNKVKDIKS